MENSNEFDLTSAEDLNHMDDYSNWQQAGATEDEEMDGRSFVIYSAAENGDHNDGLRTASDSDEDEDDNDILGDDDLEEDEGTPEWGDVDPQPSGSGPMDPSGPGSAV